MTVLVRIRVGVKEWVRCLRLKGTRPKFFSNYPKISPVSQVMALLEVIPAVGGNERHLVVIAVSWPTRLSGISPSVVSVHGVINVPNDNTAIVQFFVPIDRLSVFNQQIFTSREVLLDNVHVRGQGGCFDNVPPVLTNLDWFQPSYSHL